MILEIVIGVAIWLGSGGFAFYHLNDGQNTEGALIGCIVLGPFAAGVALAKYRDEKPTKR